MAPLASHLAVAARLATLGLYSSLALATLAVSIVMLVVSRLVVERDRDDSANESDGSGRETPSDSEHPAEESV